MKEEAYAEWGVERFLAECVVDDRLTRTRTGALYGAYSDWCEREDIFPATVRRFGLAMTALGYKREWTRGGLCYARVRLAWVAAPEKEVLTYG